MACARDYNRIELCKDLKIPRHKSSVRIAQRATHQPGIIRLKVTFWLLGKTYDANFGLITARKRSLGQGNVFAPVSFTWGKKGLPNPHVGRPGGGGPTPLGADSPPDADLPGLGRPPPGCRPPPRQIFLPK